MQSGGPDDQSRFGMPGGGSGESDPTRRIGPPIPPGRPAEQTLRAVLAARRLSYADVSRIGSQLAEALARGHAQGVPHGAVSPSAVLLRADGRARLAATSGQPLDQAYLAPEQVRGERPGPAADVYALGLVLLEAVTGQPVYPGTGRAAAEARLGARPAVPNDVPIGLARALLGMTETVPADRPSAARASVMLSGAPPGSVQQPPSTGWLGMGRKAAVVLPVLALLVLLGVALLGQWGSRSGSGTSGNSGHGSTATATSEPTRTPSPGIGTSTRTPSTQRPSLPSFSAPSLPSLPSLPEHPKLPSSVTEQAKRIWDQFTSWLDNLLGTHS
jgi:serine/threonine protein kinase